MHLALLSYQYAVDRLEVVVQVGADHDNVHTHVHPDHGDHHDGQASVDAVGLGIAYVNGKAPGEDSPYHCGEGSTGKLFLKT